MTVIKPRDEQGKIITNISHRQFVAGVNKYINTVIDIHNWECWQCKTVYDAEPAPNNFERCPNCNADPVPF